jgi:hypothetical protein
MGWRAIGSAEERLYASPHPTTALVLFNGGLIFAFVVFPVLLYRLRKLLSSRDASFNKHFWMIFFSPVGAVIIGVIAVAVFQMLRTR